MAVEIASLEDGLITGTSSYQQLYEAEGKSALIKSIILTNTDSQARTMNLAFLKAGGTADQDERLILPRDLTVPAGFSVIHESEITLSDGDTIRAKASSASKISYVISGIEREVV